MPERWLVVSGCQTAGLANSLSLLLPACEVHAIDLHAFSRDFHELRKRLDQYQYILVTPELRDKLDFAGCTNIHWVPAIYFCGYHPDLCYVKVGENFLVGDLGDYQSNIVVEGFRRGLSVEKTAELFNHNTYEQIGYYELWATERARFVADYAAEGLEIGAEFMSWARRGPFMHSVNHPTIDALFGLARAVVLKLTGQSRDLALRPHDGLAQGPVFPIFPELADVLGIAGGSYLFKPVNSYRPLALDEFITRSFALYASLGGVEMASYSLYQFKIGDVIGATR